MNRVNDSHVLVGGLQPAVGDDHYIQAATWHPVY
jgi:hypothetical protein